MGLAAAQRAGGCWRRRSSSGRGSVRCGARCGPEQPGGDDAAVPRPARLLGWPGPAPPGRARLDARAGLPPAAAGAGQRGAGAGSGLPAAAGASPGGSAGLSARRHPPVLQGRRYSLPTSVVSSSCVSTRCVCFVVGGFSSARDTLALYCFLTRLRGWGSRRPMVRSCRGWRVVTVAVILVFSGQGTLSSEDHLVVCVVAGLLSASTTTRSPCCRATEVRSVRRGVV